MCPNMSTAYTDDIKALLAEALREARLSYECMPSSHAFIAWKLLEQINEKIFNPDKPDTSRA